MAIQLKNDENNVTEAAENKPVGAGFDPNDPESKFRGGLGDGKVDIDKINDLPAYTAPPLMNDEGSGVMSGSERRSLIYKIVGGVILLIVCILIYKGVFYMTGSGGKDITEELTKTEDEIASDMKIKFEDNEAKVRAIPSYSYGKVTVRSGKDLNVVYVADKQVGVNTDSRNYRFFEVGINEPWKQAQGSMSYKYDDCIVVANDILEGNSDSYFYFNEKNNDVFVLTVNKNTARVVNMTYFTDYKRMTETLQ
ncbi:MAG: hypothetical protein J5517_10565 [Eubacterium sp.]|nr:hypothetical protein [Eubacterium sp.]